MNPHQWHDCVSDVCGPFCFNRLACSGSRASYLIIAGFFSPFRLAQYFSFYHMVLRALYNLVWVLKLNCKVSFVILTKICWNTFVRIIWDVCKACFSVVDLIWPRFSNRELNRKQGNVYPVSKCIAWPNLWKPVKNFNFTTCKTKSYFSKNCK